MMAVHSGADRALTPSGAKPVSRLGASRFDHGELEPLVHDLWRDARALSVAPASELAAHEKDIIEARECLNDALAKVERQKELAA